MKKYLYSTIFIFVGLVIFVGGFFVPKGLNNFSAGCLAIFIGLCALFIVSGFAEHDAILTSLRKKIRGKGEKRLIAFIGFAGIFFGLAAFWDHFYLR